MKVQDLRKLLSEADRGLLGKAPVDFDSLESELFPRSVKLLGDLYHMLCYGCNYYILSTEDPFRSVGREQRDLFHSLVKRTFSLGYTKEAMRQLLLDSCSGGLSRESLYQFNMMALMAELKTSDVKYMAIDAAKELVEERTNQLKTLKKYDSHEYEIRETIGNLCGMILMLYIVLAEPEKGVKYYFANCKERNKEVALYIALNYVDNVGDDNVWRMVYEYGVKKKIEPREELVRI